MVDGALLVTRNFPPKVGGTCALYANIYGKRRPDNVAVLTAEHDESSSFDAAFVREVVRVPFEPRRWTKPFEWVELGLRRFGAARRILKRRRFNEIHCGTTLPEGVIGLAAKKWMGARFVLWVHGEDVEYFRTCTIEAPIQRRILKAADRVLANSESTARLCRELGVPDERLRVVFPGVDLTAFRPDLGGASRVRQRHELGEGPILVTVARLQERKGHDKVLEALPDVLRRFPDLKYLIVGDSTGAPPEDAQKLHRLVESLDLRDAVRFVGAVSQDELAAYYSVGDLFVMPNRRVGTDIEGFGMTFLEAAACGKTCVAGNSGGAPDAVLHERTGMLVDGNDADAVASAIVRLLSDLQLRTKLETAAAARAAEFSWDRVYERFENALL